MPNQLNQLSEEETEITVEELPEWHGKLAEHVLTEWDKGKSFVTQLDSLYDDLYDMIRGERPIKNYDWESNIVINKVFQVVWTAIPYLTAKIFGQNPIIGVMSFDKKGAWQREKILDYWYNLQAPPDKTHTPFFLVVTMVLLRALLNGVGIVKKSWHQKLKKVSKPIPMKIPTSVDDNGEIIYEEKEKIWRTSLPIEDWPVNTVCNNKDIVVDWMLQPGQSIRHGRFIIHRTISDLDTLYNGDIDYINLDLLERDTDPVNFSQTQDHSQNTGKDGQDSPPTSDIYADVEIYERQGECLVYKKKEDGQWIPCLDKNDIGEKDVITKQMITTIGMNGKTPILLRFDENPYEQMTYIDLHVYFDEERWQSIGMIEPIRDLQTATNDNLNAMFDEINKNLMPPVVVNKFALWDWDTMTYAPRQRWLVGGNPQEAFVPMPSTNISRDAWSKHGLLNAEIDLTSAITPPMQGSGKEKTATLATLNAQYSMGKLDFLVKMIEQTLLIPSAQMDVMFAKKFAHALTFQTIIGAPFVLGDWEDIYKYQPAASAVKLEAQKEVEIQQDIQLVQIFSSIQNPNTPKILNALWGNILRNRNMPQEAAMFDEEYFDPQSDSGQMEMMRRRMGGNTPSNQSGVPMGQEQAGVREATFNPQGMTSG
uniref:Portal protein n=1 Tax=viral metagenome TaxID=1070528 RepID=A0A6H1Z7F0_9ZZZZ